jgi:hypothetical protein
MALVDAIAAVDVLKLALAPSFLRAILLNSLVRE